MAFADKDYRVSHCLLSFLRSQVQGWYIRENILLKAGHPGGSREAPARCGGISRIVTIYMYLVD